MCAWRGGGKQVAGGGAVSLGARWTGEGDEARFGDALRAGARTEPPHSEEEVQRRVARPAVRRVRPGGSVQLMKGMKASALLTEDASDGVRQRLCGTGNSYT